MTFRGRRFYEVEALIVLAMASQGVSLVTVLNAQARKVAA